MRQRCENPNDQAFANYGGRGITVCERWKAFENFAADMGERPAKAELDRRNNDLGYSPDNCRWLTKSENQRNKRSNRLLTHNGKTACLSEWAEITGMSRSAISSRVLRGWPVEQIFNQKPRARTINTNTP